MKKHLVIAAGILACTTLYISATPASAADVGISIGVPVPGVYVQERPVYVRPEYERDWRERQQRAYQWRERQVREREDHDRHYRDHDGHDRGHYRDD
jgi:hypothetical protein